MDARVTWDTDLRFTGVADSGYAVRMDSKTGPQWGAGPVELTAMALAACTAMDVISILTKKQERVSAFEVKVHADRATEYPKVITRASLEYVITGQHVDEAAVQRAIELSIQQYCAVHAMLRHAFPIDLKYSIFEADQAGGSRLVKSAPYAVD